MKPKNQTWGGNSRCAQKGDYGFLSQDQNVKERRIKEQGHIQQRRLSSARTKAMEHLT